MRTAPAPGRAHRAARAVVVSALVVPAVVLAHLLTRGQAPGLLGLGTVTAAVAVAGYLPRRAGTVTRCVITAQVLGHGALAALAPGAPTGGCLPTVGRGARAGMHLAMLRSDTSCPTATAAGPTLTALVGAVFAAVVLVAGQVLVAAAATRLAVTATALAAAVASLLRAALPVPPRRVEIPPPAPRCTPLPETAARPVVDTPAPRPLTRRGPPRAALAVTG